MTALPAAADFTGAAITEAQFKTALTDLRTFMADLLGTAGTQAAAQTAMQVLMGAGVAAKTTTYTLTTSDRGKVINATTGTWTLSLPAASSAGSGYCFGIKNSGSGTITIAPSGSDGIDSASITAGSARLYVCTGTAWVSFGSDSVTLSSLGGVSTDNGYGNVGSYYIHEHRESTTYTVGSTYSLSGMSGTWRCVSPYRFTYASTQNYGISMFQRIS